MPEHAIFERDGPKFDGLAIVPPYSKPDFDSRRVEVYQKFLDRRPPTNHEASERIRLTKSVVSFSPAEHSDEPS